MKVAEVIPIFKKGQKGKTTNYRPISLLSQFNKIFEKLLHSRTYDYAYVAVHQNLTHLVIDNLGLEKNYSTSWQYATFMTNY